MRMNKYNHNHKRKVLLSIHINKIPQEILLSLVSHASKNNYLVYKEDGYYSLHTSCPIAEAKAMEHKATIVDLRR